jgi:hypothetical protein
MTSLAYDGAIEALARGCIVVCTPGVDQDGDNVVCTSMFEDTHDGDGDDYLHHPEPAYRVAYLLGIAAFARESLRERHGIRCT